MQTVTAQTVTSGSFARHVRTSRVRRLKRRRLTAEQQVTHHFTARAASASARQSYEDSHVVRQPCGGGYRIHRKRIGD